MNNNKFVSISVASLFTILFVIYLACFNSVEYQQVGIAWNRFSGNLYLQRPGYYVTPPWVSVSVIDIKLERVCLQSSSRRTMSCKLVRFNPRYYREFVALEGHRYYWFSNRFSFNLGYSDEYRGFRDLLRGYSFHFSSSSEDCKTINSNSYPFIIEERSY